MKVVPAFRTVKENSNIQPTLPVQSLGTFEVEQQSILSV